VFDDRVLNCKECDKDFELRSMNKNSLLKKGSRINLDVALHVV